MHSRKRKVVIIWKTYSKFIRHIREHYKRTLEDIKRKSHTFEDNYPWLAVDFMKHEHELRWPTVMHGELLV